MSLKKKQSAQVDTNTLDLLPIALAIFDNKKIYFINKKAVELFQFPKNQLKKLQTHSLFDFLNEPYHKSIKQNNSKIIKGEKCTPLELEFKTVKNNPIFVQATSNRVLFENKYVVQTTFIDVSHLKQKQNELITSDALLQKISQNSFDVIFKFNFNPNKFIFISEAAKKVLGYSASEIYKQKDLLLKATHPDDRQFVIFKNEQQQKLKEKNKEEKIIIRFTHKNGNLIYLEIVINPTYNQKNKLIGVIGNLRDITKRVNAENLLKETKDKFDLITKNSNDIIAFFTYYPEAKYTYVSPNIKTILGYAPEELIGDSDFFNKRLLSSKDDFLKLDKIVRLDQKNNNKKTYYYIYKTHKKNRQEIWLENNLTPITGSDGKISFFLNILRDITVQKEKEIELQLQHFNYRNLLDNSPIAYIIHKQGVTVFCNQSMLKMLKLKNEKQMLGKFVLDFLAEKDRKISMQRIKEIYKGIDVKRASNYTITDSKGSLIETEMKSIVINFNNAECILTLVNNVSDQRKYENEKVKAELIKVNNEFLLLEIKERQEAEKKLLEKTAHLTSIFESSDHLIWTINKNFEVTSCNKNFLNVIEFKYNFKLKIGDKVADFLREGKQDYINYWYPKYNHAFTGKKLEFEKEDQMLEKIHRKIYINPIFNENNEVTEVNCIAHDITASKVYEQKLLSQTGKLQAIFDSSHHYIWTINNEQKLTSFNKNYFELISALYNTKPFLGLKLNRGALSNNQEFVDVLEYHYDKAFKGVATNFELDILDKDHKKVYLDVFFNPIIENDKISEVSGIAHNITQKKIDHQRVEQSLKEKDVLLKEVHHRVKNNMQIISSILNLQSSYVTDSYTLSLLKESQNRIKTMAYIHESLYQNKSFTSVNFSEYIQTLSKNIIQSYVISSEKIELILNLEKINLNLDVSIPAGLIVNELITNAIKHAFPGDRKGIIFLNLKAENNTIYVQVIDNGVGIPEGIDYNNTNTLGLQLVNTLVDQLDGEIKFKSEKEKGTEVLIKFKM